MLDEENILKKRVLEMAQKSYQNNQYFFTPFLSPAEYEICAEALEKEHYSYDSFGGTDASERVVLRFGNPEEFGYTEEYPVACVMIEPNLAKFADQLGHRDFLGSILNLGIERNVIGDIIIRNNQGYVICLKKMADYIADNLTKIKHTYVKCKVVHEMPQAIKPVLEQKQLSVSSERCDIVLSKLYNISRSDSLNLFREKKVYINSRVEESNSRNLKEGDVVSARGFGKFIYHGVQSVNKKDKLRIELSQYI
ncbi:MAG: YlmH/Sll1252 family protein [Lachnospiraceae bacterium]|nr:YlmH/Sll1252 family protein [Lachnospiraceae bacterium]